MKINITNVNADITTVVLYCVKHEEWEDKIDKAIEAHRVDEAVSVTKTKRWANSKLKK